VQRHVEVGVKEGIRGDETCGDETCGDETCGDEEAQPGRWRPGASEAGVTKCVRSWRRTRPCAEDGGESAGSYK